MELEADRGKTRRLNAVTCGSHRRLYPLTQISDIENPAKRHAVGFEGIRWETPDILPRDQTFGR